MVAAVSGVAVLAVCGWQRLVNGGAGLFCDWWWQRLMGWRCGLVGGGGWLMVVFGGGGGENDDGGGS